MKSLKVSELKNQLSATLRAVQRGRRVTVTDRDRPIALIVPYDDEDDDRVEIIPAQRSFESIRNERFPPLRRKTDSLAALKAERGGR